jgi:hypothetical protein
VAAFGVRRFDIVYTGIGALVWLSDVLEWARVVAGLLAPGRFLYLVEGHPFAQILDSGKVPLTGGPPRDHAAAGARRTSASTSTPGCADSGERRRP